MDNISFFSIIKRWIGQLHNYNKSAMLLQGISMALSLADQAHNFNSGRSA
jgi:hypothetical protein